MLAIDHSGGCEHGKEYFFVCEKEGRPISVTFGCNKRYATICPVCSQKWASAKARWIYDAILDMNAPKFITLTLFKRLDKYENLNRLWDCRNALFKALRRKGFRIKSWVGVVELPNHVHIVADTTYIPQRTISELWKTITGDSFIIDIRAVRSKKGSARYLSKYLSKSLAYDLDPERFKGFHVVQSWGVARRPKNALVCPCCGSPLISINDEYANVLDREFRDTG